MGLEEGTYFFINKGIRYVDDPTKIFKDSRRPDILLRLTNREGRRIGIVMELKSYLTEPKRYSDQFRGYRVGLEGVGYDITPRDIIHFFY